MSPENAMQDRFDAYDDAVAADIELIARIIDPVSFEKVRQQHMSKGVIDTSDAEWRCDRARDKARHIASLFAPQESPPSPP